MQIRPPGGDQRWFCPERDLVYAFPRYFRQAIFARFGGDDERTGRSYGPYRFDAEGVTEEQFAAACVKLKQLFIEMRDCQFSDLEVFKARLGELNAQILGPLLWPMFLIMLTEYREWCALVSPKEKNDVPIDMTHMERTVTDFVHNLTRRKSPVYRFMQYVRWLFAK